jgi:flagellar biosynthesis/type III secretory pathway M-ring protein FliF/YscJ
VSIFQNVDWVASLAMVVCLVVIFAIVNVRLRLSLLRREAKQLSQDALRLTMWAEERRLSQSDSATKKDEQTQVTA